MHMYAYIRVYLQQYRVYLPTRFYLFPLSFFFPRWQEYFAFFLSFRYLRGTRRNETWERTLLLLENVVFWSSLSVHVDSWIRMHYFPVKNSSDRFLTASRYPTGNCLPMDRIAASKTFPKGLQWRGHDKREIKASSKSFTIERPAFVARGSSV